MITIIVILIKPLIISFFVIVVLIVYLYNNISVVITILTNKRERHIDTRKQQDVGTETQIELHSKLHRPSWFIQTLCYY